MNILKAMTIGYYVLEAIVWVVVVLTVLGIGVILSSKEESGSIRVFEAIGLLAILFVGISMLAFWFHAKGLL